ncbi:MAG: tetratricopeptide repeat protein [Woeseiaceae bacterium]|nr:tetratricopeptide repeat protein [Woeseiaceae bacterium]
MNLLPVWMAALVLAGSSMTAAADDAATPDAGEHMLQAEIGLSQRDYLKAAEEYAAAAQLSESTEIARQATEVASSYGFNELALQSAERWLELDPDNEYALFYIARLQLRLDDVKAARATYKLLLSKSDDEPGRKLLNLLSVITEENPQNAHEVMRYLAKPYKDSAYAHYAVAVTALQADEIDEAAERVERAIELDDGWLRPKLLKGRIMMLQGDPDGAINYIALLIGDDPQPPPEARMELALLMLAEDRYDDALSQVNQIAYETGNNADALRLMGIINFRLEHLDAATEDFEELLASGRHTMDALYYLAQIADYRGDSDRALRLYSQVVRGGNAVASQQRAAALIAFQYEDAERAFERLDKFAKDNPAYAIDMLHTKAQLAGSLERYDDALAHYDQLLTFRPDTESIMLGRADTLLRMERLDDAIAQYEEAVKQFPDSAISLNALGYILTDNTDRHEEAEKYIRKAIEIEPDSPAIIDSLGWVLYKLGKPEEALVHLQKAYEGFDDPEVAAHIVEVLVALDREEEALEFLVAAEEKTPESEMLKDVRERLFASTE